MRFETRRVPGRPSTSPTTLIADRLVVGQRVGVHDQGPPHGAVHHVRQILFTVAATGHELPVVDRLL